MVLGGTSRGATHFGRPPTYLALPVVHVLHDDDADIDDGDVAKAVHDGLPTQRLGCRWRVPLTRVHNPSGVLLVYRDQLDAQTLGQVMIYVKVYDSIVISFICSHTLLTSSVNV